MKIEVDWSSTGELAPGLSEIIAEFPEKFGSGKRLVFYQENASNSEFTIEETIGEFRVVHSDKVSAFRALSWILSGSGGNLPKQEFSPFSSRGIMIDASRNAVPKVETIKYLLRRMALMGLNQLFLYCEDTYEIPSEPFFGYFRGKLTQDELREVDSYAALFDIELILCIQTLGHLEQILQWPHFYKYRDTSRVLLADYPDTYALIEKMIQAASCLRSRKIHLGMDEADGVGAGEYRTKFGTVATFEILLSHLNAVLRLCEKHGMEALIWSDMFLRQGSKTKSYYDTEFHMSEADTGRVPSKSKLVYWDYYHKDRASYSTKIEHHLQLGSKPVFATCIWTMQRFVPLFEFTEATMTPGMEAAREAGLQEVLATVWGDDGNECNLSSTFPGMQLFAELCFGNGVAEADVLYSSLSRGSWKAAASASRLDSRIDSENYEYDGGNPSKWILWHDPLIGFLEACMPPGTAERFSKIAMELEALADNDSGSGLAFPLKLAKVLSIKCVIHRDLRPAYQRRDLATIRRLVKNEIPRLMEKVLELKDMHFTEWCSLYKPFGWEVLDLRYGGLWIRLRSLMNRLNDFIADPSTSITELDEIAIPLQPGDEPYQGMSLKWMRTAAPSFIYPGPRL